MRRLLFAFLLAIISTYAVLGATQAHAQAPSPPGQHYVLSAPIPPGTNTPGQTVPVLAAPAATPAHWEGLSYVISDTWTCSPVAALTGYQLNVKTSTFQQGVSLGGGAGCRYTGWSVPLSIEAVGGFAANSNAPNAGQGNLIFVVADNFGIGPGMQIFKDPTTGDYTEQMLVSFFLTGSWASTIEQSKKLKAQAKAEAREGR
jgi:hypothetical protein